MKACRFKPNSKALAKGARVEKREHGLSAKASRKIARDHLCSNPRYYARSFSGIRRSYSRVPNLTIPLYRALIKVANAGIGHPGTQRKVTRLIRWGLIRPVRNTRGYELTSKGAVALQKMEE